jgi:hypothetical protein
MKEVFLFISLLLSQGCFQDGSTRIFLMLRF